MKFVVKGSLVTEVVFNMFIYTWFSGNLYVDEFCWCSWLKEGIVKIIYWIYQYFLEGQWFSWDTMVSSTNKPYCYKISYLEYVGKNISEQKL